MTQIATAVLSLREALGPSHPRQSRPRWTSLFGLGRNRRQPGYDDLSDHLLHDIGLSRADLAALDCESRRA